MRTLIFLSCFLLAVSLSAQQPGKNPEKLLTVLKERYSINYPESWAVDSSRVYGMDILFRSPKTDSLDDFSENLNVFTQNLNGLNYTLSQMGQESEVQIKNMITDATIIESRLDSSSSRQCYILKYKGRQGKFSLTTLQRYYLKDGVGYAVTFTIKQGKEVEYNSVAEKMFSSFTFR